MILAWVRYDGEASGLLLTESQAGNTQLRVAELVELVGCQLPLELQCHWHFLQELGSSDTLLSSAKQNRAVEELACDHSAYSTQAHKAEVSHLQRGSPGLTHP